VQPTPSVEYVLRLDRGWEDVDIQAFVAQATVEAFDEGVLYRFPRPNKLKPA
jgi:hypothetical protein